MTYCQFNALTWAGITRARNLRNFLAQDIAESITHKALFLGKILAARILRGILRKKLDGYFTRNAFGNIVENGEFRINKILNQFFAMPGLRKRQAAAAAVILIHYKQQKKRKRRWWLRPWLARGNAIGAYTNLMREISVEDPQLFRIFLRMSADNLEEILRLVGPLISKKDTSVVLEQLVSP